MKYYKLVQTNICFIILNSHLLETWVHLDKVEKKGKAGLFLLIDAGVVKRFCWVVSIFLASL